MRHKPPSFDHLSRHEIEALIKRELSKFRSTATSQAIADLSSNNLEGSANLIAEITSLKRQITKLKPIVSSVLRGKKFTAKIPAAVEEEVDRVSKALKNWPKLRQMFRECFISTLDTTTYLLDDGTTHVITGDIPAMWLRDSAAQVNHYLPLAGEDVHLQIIIEGLIQRQANRILLDPYANAYRKDRLENLSKQDRDAGKTEEIWERKYEVDSLCYFLSLSYKYWAATGIEGVFNEEWERAARLIVKTWKLEQNHDPATSPYKFHPEMPAGGRGASKAYTGMTWSGFRPSDDACMYPYLIPSNMFAVVTLGYLAEIAEKVLHDPAFAAEALELRTQIDDGIHKYGVVDSDFGRVYAYETDGLGHHNMMDDANVPSLLSIPYLGYTSPHDPDHTIARNTRKFVLSSKNPYYYTGTHASGIGSPHTWRGWVWHIALAMQGLTSDDPEEIVRMVRWCINTDAGSGFMHESFHPSNPQQFTRPWFAWANSLFGEFVRTKLDVIAQAHEKEEKQEKEEK
jgi:meiotically up-regulated gene 157 (Mug157) protein